MIFGPKKLGILGKGKWNFLVIPGLGTTKKKIFFGPNVVPPPVSLIVLGSITDNITTQDIALLCLQENYTEINPFAAILCKYTAISCNRAAAKSWVANSPVQR